MEKIFPNLMMASVWVSVRVCTWIRSTTANDAMRTTHCIRRIFVSFSILSSLCSGERIRKLGGIYTRNVYPPNKRTNIFWWMSFRRHNATAWQVCVCVCVAYSKWATYLLSVISTYKDNINIHAKDIKKNIIIAK